MSPGFVDWRQLAAVGHIGQVGGHSVDAYHRLDGLDIGAALDCDSVGLAHKLLEMAPEHAGLALPAAQQGAGTQVEQHGDVQQAGSAHCAQRGVEQVGVERCGVQYHAPCMAVSPQLHWCEQHLYIGQLAHRPQLAIDDRVGKFHHFHPLPLQGIDILAVGRLKAAGAGLPLGGDGTEV